MPSSKKNRPPRAPDIINRDGTLNIHRPLDPAKFFSDMHHYLLSISWPKFFFILIVLFLLGNLLFALLYFYLPAGAVEGMHPNRGWLRFADSFFFSVQGLDGAFTPVGTLPNALVIVEGYLGMLTLVIATGLFYARFARPTARVVFSDNAIITTYNGKRALVFRVANERLNRIIEAHMTLTLTRNETSKEGETSRKFHNLKLEVEYSPLFALSWTIRHFIDEDSALYGVNEEKMNEQKVAIFASLSGLDDTFSQTITARTVYRYDEIVYDKRFKDILKWDGNKIRIDLKGIHDLI